MIITRTPFRISFFGGGTDIPEWFSEEGGQVLSTTIDKYCYVTARKLPPFFNHSIRLAYSRIETVSSADEITHPLIKTVLQDLDKNDIEIHYDADLPGRSGLGSSSSFGVGLLSACTGMDGRLLTKHELADKVIHYERNVLKESGGFQDQIAAAFGGLNHITFSQSGKYSVSPVTISKSRLSVLQASLVLCYVPIERFSADVSLAKNYNKKACEANLRFIYDSVNTALDILYDGDINDFGYLMNEAWQRKRDLKGVTNTEIDSIYEKAISAGALGGKLLGAGGGGFMLFFCPPEKQNELMKALSPLLIVPFDFEQDGNQIIYYRP